VINLRIGEMIRIKISTSFPEWPLLRQTPRGFGRWADCEFLVNQDIEECDWWVVVDDLPKTEATNCSPKNTIFINCEPPTVKSYRRDFLAQFSAVLSCQGGRLDHPKIIHSQSGLRWGVGVRIADGMHKSTMDYDEIRNLTPKKTKLISVMTSSRDLTRGHRDRIAFVRRLKEHFGERLDVFGFGIRAVEDKLDALAEYQYHVVIENSCFPDYWTEKLADAYLATSYPLYAGCPNLEKYFPRESFTKIDLHNFPATVARIEAVIAARRFEKSEHPLAAARELVLTKYNLFGMLAEECHMNIKGADKRPLTIRPWRLFEPKSAVLAQKVRNKILYSWKGQHLVNGFRNFLPVR